jgi:hypothetical protein
MNTKPHPTLDELCQEQDAIRQHRLALMDERAALVTAISLVRIEYISTQNNKRYKEEGRAQRLRELDNLLDLLTRLKQRLTVLIEASPL